MSYFSQVPFYINLIPLHMSLFRLSRRSKRMIKTLLGKMHKPILKESDFDSDIPLSCLNPLTCAGFDVVQQKLLFLIILYSHQVSSRAHTEALSIIPVHITAHKHVTGLGALVIHRVTSRATQGHCGAYNT